jgi:hypothetical protein
MGGRAAVGGSDFVPVPERIATFDIDDHGRDARGDEEKAEPRWRVGDA